jgi:hypothetical protein
MLEHIDDVPWSEIQHCYGPADDVPGLIRQLASSDSEMRREALSELSGNILHQGTVFEATSYAVPFLIELLQEPSVADKHWLLVLLADLATGSSYWDVHQHLSIFKDSQDDHMSEIETELGWVKAAHDGVLAGRTAYLQLLEDGDEKVRMAAAFLLGTFPEAAEENFEALRAVYAAEQNENVRAAQVLAIGSLVFSEERIVRFLEEVLTSSEARAVQVAAALGLAWASSRFPLTPEAESSAVTVLSEIAEYPGEVAKVFNELPGQEAEVVTDCCGALSVLVGQRHTASQSSEDPGVTRVLSSMIAGLQRVPPYQTWDIVDSLLSIVFGGRPMPESATLPTLAPQQRMVLEAILDSDPFWGDDEKDKIWVKRAEVMRAFGLPKRRKKLRAFLRGELSPADQEWKGL